MSIDMFLNPHDEVVADDNGEAIEAQIAAQFETQPDHESDEELEVIQRVSIREALAALEALRLYEEQQEDGNHTVIASLNEHYDHLKHKQLQQLRQSQITNFFNTNPTSNSSNSSNTLIAI